MADLDCLIQPDHGTDGKFTLDRPHTSPEPAQASILHSPERTRTKQQRLLQGRNARFLAKKLSISSLNSRLTGLVHTNDDSSTLPYRDQENRIHKSKSAGTLRKKSASSHSLPILGEISNSTKYRSYRKRNDFDILQDNLERPLLDNSPFSSPQLCNISSSENNSPAAFDHIQDSLTEMRSREISANELFSPAYHSSLKNFKQIQKRRPVQPKFKFDAEEYIEHIERELQQVKEDAYCSETGRPLKDQLKLVNVENEKLHEELSFLRERFESEVKRTLEHNTTVEADLRRKVRDLEEKLDTKEQILEELQYQREEKRLDVSVIEALKGTIERLEHEKQAMEIENANVTKRNDVLTQLLAMSPTKIHPADPTSPVREKRTYRPLSLVFPRMPESPGARNTSCDNSQTTSPGFEPLDYFGGRALTLSTELPGRSVLAQIPDGLEINSASSLEEKSPTSDVEACSRRWTFHQHTTATSISAGNGSLSPSEEKKIINKRRPRKFLRGSTQLKPLLLSALNEGTIQPSPSTISSPGEPRARSSSDLSTQASFPIDHQPEIMSDVFDVSTFHSPSTSGPGPACEDGESLDLDADETLLPLSRDFTESDSHNLAQKQTIERLNFNDELREPLPLPDNDTVHEMLSCHHRLWDQMVAKAPRELYSRQNDLTNTTIVPPPLFSPRRQGKSSRLSLVEFERIDDATNRSAEIYSSRRRHQSGVSVDASFDSPTARLPRKRPLSSSLSLLAPLPSPPAVVHIQGTSYNAKSTKSRPVSAQYGLHVNNPLDIFKQKDFRARSVASLGIRTVYGLLATCTSVIRQAKKSPFALTKKVLANLWRANWAVMGKASWWVLGLFLDAGQRAQIGNSLGWEEYDGEAIAHRICASPTINENGADRAECASNMSHENPAQSSSAELQDSQTSTEPNHHDSGCWGRSLSLWGRFSVAIMLTVGGAIVKGPAEMLQKLETSEGKGREKQNHESCRSLDGDAGFHRSRHENGFHAQRRWNRQSMNDRSSWTTSYQSTDASCESSANSVLRKPILFTSRDEDIDGTLRPPSTPKPRVSEVFIHHDILPTKDVNPSHDLVTNNTGQG